MKARGSTTRPGTKQRKQPEEFVPRAVELGAAEAKLVPTRRVFTAEWVRLKCQYGCGAYASSRNCPPYSPTPERTRRILGEYRAAILVHGGQTADIRQIVTSWNAKCSWPVTTRLSPMRAVRAIYATVRP